MEDDAGRVALEDPTHPCPVADVGEDGHARREAALRDELALDLEQRRLGLVDEDQPPAADVRDLAAELGADRAAGAGDQHRLVGQIRRDRFEVDLDRLAAEHVLDLHRPDLAGEIEIARDQLVDAGQRLHGHAGLSCDVHDALAHLAGGGRDRDQHLVGPVLAQDPRQVGRRPEHADVVHAEVLLPRVVVDEPDRRVAERVALQHLLDDQLGGVAGADHDHLLAAGDEAACAGPLHQRPREHSCAGDEREQEQPVHDRHRPGQADLLNR